MKQRAHEDPSARHPLPEVDTEEITELLNAWVDGKPGAGDRLFEAVYPQLRGLAAQRLAQEDFASSMQTSDLVHEAYLRLVDQSRVRWQCRAHFFAIAATMIRRIVIDHGKHRRRSKRGADTLHLPLEGLCISSAGAIVEPLVLDQALTRLALIDIRAARIVELRFFAGLSLEEVAGVLRLGRATVIRSWRFARAFLRHHLSGHADDQR